LSLHGDAGAITHAKAADMTAAGKSRKARKHKSAAG